MLTLHRGLTVWPPKLFEWHSRLCVHGQ